MSTIEIFFSYSHKDEPLREGLEKQLSLLKWQGFIIGWHDRRIVAGQEWADEIDTHLDTAQIILLLVSPDFMASDYCYGIEMKRAMERYETRQARVIPIILRPTDWKSAPFGQLEALPRDGKAVVRWRHRDDAFLDIARGIRNIIEELNALPSTTSTHMGRKTTSQHTENILLCPYRGLSVFREQDAPFFFGREIFAEQLMESVRRKPLVAVIGPSGSGKSSLVFAGLLPRLSHEGNWRVASFRPRDRPFRSLAAALIPMLETQMSETELLVQIKKLAEPLQQGELSLYDVVERIMQKHRAARLLLFVDQFEELYTLCRNAEDRQRFLDTLLEAISAASQQQTLNLTLILTLRADFFGQALLYRPFADALQNADLKLSPMNRQELQDVIKKPAEQLSVRIEDGLTERILEAVSQEPGNLPLLEFTLTQLWDKRRNNMLAHDAYNEIGGVEQSLATYAENIYTRLNPEEQQQARRIFVQLVYPGKGTEDIRRIATHVQVGEESWNLIVRLSDARLVVSDRDEVTSEETVEVIHEALIRGWNRLRKWMEEDREFRLWQERLRTRMSEWERANYSRNELLRGIMLAESEHWLAERNTELSQAERDFIQASQNQIQEEQHWREQYEYIGNTFASIAIGVITMDSSGSITTFNNAAGVILQINPLTALGKHYQEVFWALPQTHLIELLQNAISQHDHGTIVPHSVECVIPNRGQVNLDLHVSSLRDEGTHIGMALVISDRTDIERAKAEAKEIRGIFGRYVHPNVVQQLFENPKALNPETKEISILSVDMRGFTGLSESMASENVMNLLNNYFDIMVKEIWDEGGTTTGFWSDALMAIFNAPLRQEDHALRAVRAAWKMRMAILDYQSSRPQGPQISFGIGVNTGVAVVGNLGSRGRMQNYTAIGDVVNVASRLQGKASDYKILLSHTTFIRVRQHVRVTKFDPLYMRGRRDPLEVWLLEGLV